MQAAATALVLFLAAATGGAQESPDLAVTDARPAVDGVVSQGEYPLSRQIGRATLYASRTADRVFLAVSAPTAGWVAVGTGTGRMDGSRIFIGYVHQGIVTFREDLGSGHAHGEAGDAPAALAHALTERDGRTTIEVELDASRVVAAGSTQLRLIAAYGASDSLTPRHAYRTSLTLPLR
jgi:hypothetical protein